MRRAGPVAKGLSIAAFALLAAGCGGYGESEAQLRCEIDQENNAACFNDEAFAACLDCYTECGDSCALAESCPIQYTCP
jgi:hypothetical protein